MLPGVRPLRSIAAPTPYSLSVPMEGIDVADNGGYRISIRGETRAVVYHVERRSWYVLASSSMGMVPAQPVWRNALGQWEINADDAGAQPAIPCEQWCEIALPPVPAITVDARPLPRVIHYVWIGEHGVPEALAQRMRQSALRCRGYRVRLHAHISTCEGWQRLEAQFSPQSGIELVDLSREAHFFAFGETPLGGFYRYFVSEAGTNYGAASDILRVYLLHREGGIYMDVDDEVTHAVDVCLNAGPDDLLLNRMVTVPQYGFHGYANSNFGCHAGNRVLAEMLSEMGHRLSAETATFEKLRPWRRVEREPTDGERKEMLDYILSIFRLTGPVLFNDVVRATRPDYYWIERALLAGYQRLTVSPSEPCVLANDYFDRMHAAKSFYLPFAEASFDIALGSAHSWNSARKCSG